MWDADYRLQKPADRSFARCRSREIEPPAPARRDPALARPRALPAGPRPPRSLALAARGVRRRGPALAASRVRADFVGLRRELRGERPALARRALHGSSRRSRRWTFSSSSSKLSPRALPHSPRISHPPARSSRTTTRSTACLHLVARQRPLRVLEAEAHRQADLARRHLVAGEAVDEAHGAQALARRRRDAARRSRPRASLVAEDREVALHGREAVERARSARPTRSARGARSSPSSTTTASSRAPSAARTSGCSAPA